MTAGALARRPRGNAPAAGAGGAGSPWTRALPVFSLQRRLLVLHFTVTVAPSVEAMGWSTDAEARPLSRIRNYFNLLLWSEELLAGGCARCVC